MLAAIARGAATGAAMGGAIGGAGQALGKLARPMGEVGEHAASGEAGAALHAHAYSTEHVTSDGAQSSTARSTAISSTTKDFPAAKPATRDLKQRVSNLDELYQEAAAAHVQLAQATEDVAHEVGGQALVAPLKGRARAIEKVQADYSGDYSRLTDLVRSTVICEDMAQVNGALEAVQSRLKVVRLKNRFESPYHGYRDILMNVELPNGHIGELQIHLRGILEVKETTGHKLFEQIRSLDAKAAIEHRSLTPAERQLRDQYENKMQNLYDAAYNKATPPTSEEPQ